MARGDLSAPVTSACSCADPTGNWGRPAPYLPRTKHENTLPTHDEESLLDLELISLTQRPRPLDRAKPAASGPAPQEAPSAPPSHWELLADEPIPDLAPMRDGRPPHLRLCRAKSDLFTVPVLVASDLHKDGLEVFSRLARQPDALRWQVILCGDMAGTSTQGEDGPIGPLYDCIQANFGGLHAVLGNHDRATPEDRARRNPDGSPCLLDGAPRLVGGRRLCGVSFIAGRAQKYGRISPAAFDHALAAALGTQARESVLVTHDTPRVEGFTPFIGRDELRARLAAQPPRAHLFGHCHLRPITVQRGPTLFVAADARVLQLVPWS